MLLATALVLVAALLHAGWNLLVKTSEDRFHAAWGQFLFGGLLFLPVLIVIGLPNWREAIPFLAASGLVHVLYVTALVRAYHHGDFSLAYPLARGAGAVLAAVGGVLFLGDVLDPWAWLAILVIVAGLVALVGRQVEPVTIGWALLTGLAIGTYTTVDAAGSRETAGFAYGICTTIAAAVALSVVGVVRGEQRAFAWSVRFNWRRYAVAGVCLTAAYSLVMVAVRWAPVGYVAVLRESSVVIGAYAGWVLLHERLGRRRLASSVVITTGLALLVVLR